MKNIIAAALGAVGALAAPLASAENLFFTNSNVVSLPVARADGTASSANACVKDGVCSSALSFDTATAGVLTVTADDHDGARHDSALVYQSKDVNAGLGVASGYTKNGAFVINDGNDALDSATETLTLHFASAVSVYALYFFPDDRSTYAATHELDRFDGFTLSIDGGKAVEYSFGSLGGQGVSFSTPLTGTTFAGLCQVIVQGGLLPGRRGLHPCGRGARGGHLRPDGPGSGRDGPGGAPPSCLNRPQPVA